jgi:hypothetical protein
MLKENQQVAQTEQMDGPFLFKKIIGLLLVLMGIAATLWACYCIFVLFGLAGDQSTDVPIVGTILKYYELDNKVQVPDGVIVLPRVVYFVAGFILYILVLRIIQGVAKTLLTTGANLLESELSLIAKKFRNELKTLKGIIAKHR